MIIYEPNCKWINNGGLKLELSILYRKNYLNGPYGFILWQITLCDLYNNLNFVVIKNLYSDLFVHLFIYYLTEYTDMFNFFNFKHVDDVEVALFTYRTPVPLKLKRKKIVECQPNHQTFTSLSSPTPHSHFSPIAKPPYLHFSSPFSPQITKPPLHLLFHSAFSVSPKSHLCKLFFYSISTKLLNRNEWLILRRWKTGEVWQSFTKTRQMMIHK